MPNIIAYTLSSVDCQIECPCTNYVMIKTKKKETSMYLLYRISIFLDADSTVTNTRVLMLNGMVIDLKNWNGLKFSEFFLEVQEMSEEERTLLAENYEYYHLHECDKCR